MTKQGRSENLIFEQSQKRKEHDALRLPRLLMEEQHKLNLKIQDRQHKLLIFCAIITACASLIGVLLGKLL